MRENFYIKNILSFDSDQTWLIWTNYSLTQILKCSLKIVCIGDRGLCTKKCPFEGKSYCACALHLPTPSPLVALATVKGGLTARGKERRGTETNHMTATHLIISVFGYTSFVLGLRATTDRAVSSSSCVQVNWTGIGECDRRADR